ncbi:MAG: HU family DNA-binding protein [Bacillota bacterium]
MNKAQLIELVSERTKSTKTQSELILDATLRVIQEALKKGDDVKLVGFGTFSKATRKPRQGRNPKTGEAVKIPSAHIPRFKPGKDLKDSLN